MKFKKIITFFFLYVLLIEGLSAKDICIYLSDNYEALNSPKLTAHIKNQVDLWKVSVSDKDYGSFNKLKVGLYAYEESSKSWDFYSDENRYVSGWSKDKYLQSNDRTISSYYGSVKAEEVSSGGTPKLSEDFENRGINLNKDKKFNHQSYSHSEQAWISNLQHQADREALKKYDRFLLLLVSTNEVCDNCKIAIEYLLGKDGFGELIYRFQNSEKLVVDDGGVKEKEGPSNAKKAKVELSVAMLYESSSPQKFRNFDANQNGKLYLHVGSLTA